MPGRVLRARDGAEDPRLQDHDAELQERDLARHQQGLFAALHPYGEISWDWMPADHFEEFGHSEAAKNAIMRHCRNQHAVFQNTISYVGPNKWFDAGDERFDPENIITDDRGTILYIISKKTGEIVWKIGPDYASSPELRALGCIIGPHHAHIIPKGLPGEGNSDGG